MDPAWQLNPSQGELLFQEKRAKSLDVREVLSFSTKDVILLRFSFFPLRTKAGFTF